MMAKLATGTSTNITSRLKTRITRDTYRRVSHNHHVRRFFTHLLPPGCPYRKPPSRSGRRRGSTFIDRPRTFCPFSGESRSQLRRYRSFPYSSVDGDDLDDYETLELWWGTRVCAIDSRKSVDQARRVAFPHGVAPGAGSYPCRRSCVRVGEVRANRLRHEA